MTFQVEEILSCSKSRIAKYGVNSSCLAYPFGINDNNTFKAVKTLRIEACFTTSATDVYAYLDMAMIGRHQVFNEDGASLKNRLNN